MPNKRFYRIGFGQDDLGSSPPSIALLSGAAICSVVASRTDGENIILE
ncbi:hypothetical protein [Nostoc sp.]